MTEFTSNCKICFSQQRRSYQPIDALNYWIKWNNFYINVHKNHLTLFLKQKPYNVEMIYRPWFCQRGKNNGLDF